MQFTLSLTISCIYRSFDAENSENNLRQMDDFVNVLKKNFKAVVMNQSVRGIKVKKEKEIILAAVVEDYSASVALLLSGNIN